MPETKRLLVGVFVQNLVIDKLLKQKDTYSIVSLERAGRVVGNIVYFFSIKDVDLKKKKITGTYFDIYNQLWKQKMFPFPDVFYNRRSEGKNKRVKMFRATIRELDIPSINPVNDVDKWELTKELIKDQSVSPYIPETILWKNKGELKRMLERHGIIYLKAVVGRYSRFVMRVRMLENSAFEYSYVGDKLIVGTTKSWKELDSRIKRFFSNKDVIIQQGINVFTVDDCNIDMRAELQRNKYGEIEIVANSARKASPGSPVTSTRADAAIFKFDQYFKENSGLTDDQFQGLLSSVESLLFTVYKSVENIYGTFGEMGIDYAIDKSLRLWLIECNVKSAKVALFLSYEPHECDFVFENIMKYASYLVHAKPKKQ